MCFSMMTCCFYLNMCKNIKQQQSNSVTNIVIYERCSSQQFAISKVYSSFQSSTIYSRVSSKISCYFYFVVESWCLPLSERHGHQHYGGIIVLGAVCQVCYFQLVACCRSYHHGHLSCVASSCMMIILVSSSHCASPK